MNPPAAPQHDRERRADTVTGAVLGAAAILSLVMVLHHPVVRAHDADALAQGVAAVQDMNRLVHGVLIGLVILLTGCMARLTWRLGAGRLAGATALAAYGLGAVLVILAAVLDGFVTTDLGLRWASGPHGAIPGAMAVFAFISVVIQEATKLGLLAQAAATVLWSALLAAAPGPRRLVGLLGMAGGAATAVLILQPGLVLTPQSLLWTMALQSAWYLALAAALMLKGLGETRRET